MLASRHVQGLNTFNVSFDEQAYNEAHGITPTSIVKNIDEIGKIIKKGIADNKAFYHVFLETLKKMGKA